MFKFLLATRYLRTRYIALASIVSVMLGVATMIVVNSVMSGFREEMYNRLHGILSDVVVASHGLDGIDDSVAVVGKIQDVLGADLDGLTTTVHVPAVLSYRVFDEWEIRHVNLIGIDDASYASISDFSKFLLHPQNQKQLSFNLREDGYDERLEEAGWGYRRWRHRDRAAYRDGDADTAPRHHAAAHRSVTGDFHGHGCIPCSARVSRPHLHNGYRVWRRCGAGHGRVRLGERTTRRVG